MNFSRFSLRGRRAASGVEYALLVGLVSLVSIGAIAMVGGTTKDVFCNAEKEVAASLSQGEVDCSDNPAPVVVGSFASSAIGYGGSTDFAWTASSATSLIASSTYNGSCDALDSFDGTARALPWDNVFTGSGIFAWDQSLAGCSEEICLEARNAGKTTSICSSLLYEPWDNLPAAFSFADIDDAAPSSLVASGPVTLSGFDGVIPVAIDPAGNDAAYRIDGGAWQSSGGGVAAGQTIEIRVRANTDFAGTPATASMQRSVTLTAGAGSSEWTVRNAAPDTDPDAFSFGVNRTGLLASTTATSSKVTFSGFDLTHTLTLTPTVNASAGTLAYSLNDGAFVNLAGTVTLANRPAGTRLQLRITTPSTYPSTARNASVSVSIGGKSATWTAGIRAGAACSATGQLNWWGPSGQDCHSTPGNHLPNTPAGGSATAKDTEGYYQGSAIYSCNPNGSWSLTTSSCYKANPGEGNPGNG